MRKAGEPGEDIPRHCFVLMRLTHTELAPEAVTRLLELEPTDCWINGSLDAFNHIRDYGCWSISTASHVDSFELDDHLNWVLDRLEQKNEQLAELKSEFPKLRIFINVQWSIRGFNKVFLLDERLILRMAKSALGLDFLISFN